MYKKCRRSGGFKYLSDDKLDKAISDLQLFLNGEQIDIESDSLGTVHQSNYFNGLDLLIKKVVNTIKDDDVNCIITDKFDYFKGIKLSNSPMFKNVTLYGESGLGLDMLSIKNLKYYKFERELCYIIEAIVYKLHNLGMLLKRQDILLELVERIYNNITDDIDYTVKSLLSEIIYSISFETIADDIILYIQGKKNITDGFITNDQVTKSLKRKKILK